MSLTDISGRGLCDCVNLKNKIYGYEKKIENVLRRIKESSIDDDSKEKILEFYDELLAQGYSKARILKYLDTLCRIAVMLGKSFVEANKDDIACFVRKIEAKDYSEWTKHDYKVILKLFYRWLRGAEEYPEEVRWIKPRVKNNNLLPDGLLTEEEVKGLAEAAGNPRDRALVLVLYESGCRVGEILSLSIKNVQFDEYGAQLIVSGKTGSRRVRIIFSAPRLAQWIENHPLRNDPDAPLWVSLGTRDRNEALTYGAAKSVIKDLASKASIRKRIYPHLFRHSRATYLANHLTEAQMKHMFGWVQSSKMAGTYVHLSGRDVDKPLLKLSGIRSDEDQEHEKFQVRFCPRCKTRNSPDSKFCNSCGLCFDVKSTMQIDEVREKADRLMTELVKQPEVLDVLIEALHKERK